MIGISTYHRIEQQMTHTRAKARASLGRLAARLLAEVAAPAAARPRRRASPEEIAELVRADLVVRHADGSLALTAAGRAHLKRAQAVASGDDISPFAAQHLDFAAASGSGSGPRMNAAESPLVWLARRKGRDRQPLIAPEQLQAGERLRADFTRAQMMPRVTANWTAAIAQSRRTGTSPANLADTVIAARQRVRHALDAVGPEFAGLLVDVCCFLKGLEDVERERCWPARSAKLVLQLGLGRLARHYGLAGAARGRAHAPLRAWWALEEA
jgi:hypothetical protein